MSKWKGVIADHICITLRNELISTEKTPMSLTFTAKDDSAVLHYLVPFAKNGLLAGKFAAKSDLMRFSQLANISRLHFHFHDNWEFRPHSPSTFLPVNSFLSVHNLGQHRDHQPIRISFRQSTLFFKQDHQSFWNVLHNCHWYRVMFVKDHQ